MARKKAVPIEEENTTLEVLNLPETEAAEETHGFPEGLPEHTEENAGFKLTDSVETPQENIESEENSPPPSDLPDIPPVKYEAGTFTAGTTEAPPENGMVSEMPTETTDSLEVQNCTEVSEPLETASEDTADPPVDTAENPVENIPEETGSAVLEAAAPIPPQNDRQSFYGLNFNELDRDLTAEERQEWNSIYASYRGRSALTGTIIGVDPHSISVRNQETGQMERQTMYCAIVIPYRVRVVIPASEMWEAGHERPDFVLQNMVGASIDFIIIKVDRESGFAIGSRRLAARSQRYFFAHRPALCREGTLSLIHI